MKKSELTQFTQIVEILVKREIKKQLPQILAEAFQNMGNKPVIQERQEPIRTVDEEGLPSDENDTLNMRQSLKEMFAGAEPVTRQPQISSTPKHYTKDPKLNAVLNETVGDLRAREGMVGMAAFQGGYNPTVMASAPPTMTTVADGASITGGEQAVPLAALPQGISALDVARQVPLDKEVKYALTKNYSELMKRIDQKRGKK